MACDLCDNGWRIVERNGYSAAERCPCAIPIKKTVLKPSIDKIGQRVLALSKLIPFFPSDELSLKIITAEVQNFCDDEENLIAFCREAMRYFTKWQGVAPLRALYCSMFRPADGIYPTLTFQDAEGRTQIGLPGYTEPELLSKFQAADKRERDQESERLERLAIATGSEPFPIPEARRIAERAATSVQRETPESPTSV